MAQPSPLRRIAWPAAAAAISVTAYLSFPTVAGWLHAPAVRADSAEPIRIVLGAASYFSVAWLASRLTGIALGRTVARRRRLPKLLAELITAGFFLTATLATVMLVVGHSLTGALAGSGLVVAVLGFALRNVIGDVFSGVALGLEAPFRIGDWVEIENVVRGRIVEVGWRTTRLHTPDQTYMILPNSQIATQRLTNYSAPRRRYRAQLRLVLDHDIAVAEAKKVMAAAAAHAKPILSEPAPDVRVVAYEPAGISYVVRYWVSSFTDDVDCRDAVLSSIDTALRSNCMPPPRQRVLSWAADEPSDHDRGQAAPAAIQPAPVMLDPPAANDRGRV